MARRHGGLGRGLSALFPDEPEENSSESSAEEQGTAEEKPETKELETTEEKGSSSAFRTGKGETESVSNRSENARTKRAGRAEKASTEDRHDAAADQNKGISSEHVSSAEQSTFPEESNIEESNAEETKLPGASAGVSAPAIQKTLPSGAVSSEEILTMRLSKIEPDPSQPRKNFTEEELDSLAASIKEHGLLQPIVVTPKEGTDRYLIVAGERRWRACQKAGIPSIQVVIRNFSSDADRLEASLIENIQREDLNPIEEALGYQRLMNDFGLTQEEAAAKVSRSRTAVANSLRLLKLTPEVQNMVASGSLSMGHARALISVEDPDQQKELANMIVEKGLSVREVEKMIRAMGKTHRHVSRETNPSLDAIYKEVQDRMQQSLGMNVKVSYKKDKSGKVEIAFANDEDLDKLMERIFES